MENQGSNILPWQRYKSRSILLWRGAVEIRLCRHIRFVRFQTLLPRGATPVVCSCPRAATTSARPAGALGLQFGQLVSQ
jgi:hypothetical protein